MQLTKLRAAPERRAEVPPCAPAGETNGGTASQLIRSVGPTMQAMAMRAVATAACLMIILASGCSRTREQARPQPESSVQNDIAVVDAYLSKWDRFAQGEEALVPQLREGKNTFESALTRVLRAKDERGPARLVFYPIVQVGGGIPLESELGKAAAEVVGSDCRLTTTKSGARIYFAGDLYFWWKRHGSAFQAYPLFDEWQRRDFAQTVVLPMYEKVAKK